MTIFNFWGSAAAVAADGVGEGVGAECSGRTGARTRAIGLGARATAVGATMRLSVPAVAYPGRHDRLLGIMVSGGMTRNDRRVEDFPRPSNVVHLHFFACTRTVQVWGRRKVQVKQPPRQLRRLNKRR